MDNQKEVLLEVQNLKQHFKLGRTATVKAVDNVSFTIHKGETFGVVGESGSGKSTTGRSIIRLYEPTDGKVYFKGKLISVGVHYVENLKKKMQELQDGSPETRDAKVTELVAQYEALENKSNNKAYKLRQEIERLRSIDFSNKETLLAGFNAEITEIKEFKRHEKHVIKSIRKDMQMIFQDPMACLNPRMRVIDIIAEGLDIHKIAKTKAEREKLVYEILEIVGLRKDHAGRYPHEFSGGQRQRIGIARALITRPDFIIADEPISALDVSIQAQVVNLMKKLQQEMGLTFLFIAHDLSMVRYFCDRIAVMHLGHIVEMGTSEQIYNHPVHPYTKSLLSAIPQPDPIHERTRSRILYTAKSSMYEDRDLHDLGNDHFVLGTAEEIAQWTK